MDIQYLLFLQNLRGATGGVFNEFFNALSKIAVDVMIFLPYLIFWCVDKGWGYRFMTSIRGGEVLNGIVKLTVCAYRRDRLFVSERPYDVRYGYIRKRILMAV